MPFLPRPSFVLLACVLVFWQQLPSSPVTTPSNPQEQEAPQKTPPSPPANAPKQVPTASTEPRTLKEQAWEVLQTGATADKTSDRAAAIQATGLIPSELVGLGFHHALGLIPFAGFGWRAFKVVKKDDSSPARAGAATVLAKDRDPKTTEALVNAVGDKNWIIRAAALEALARRGNPSVLRTVDLYLSAEEGDG